MKPQGKLTTQKDVARLAGVSQAIVSVVLSGNTRNIGVSPEVADRVLSAAKRLNYRPNLSARSMRQGRFFNIGYFAASSDCGEHDFAQFRAGIYDAASEQGFHVMMIRLPSNLSKDPDVVPRTFREAHLDAMIINPMTLSINAIKEMVGSDNTLPIVYLNVKEEFGSVYVDDYHGARLATGHLFDQGFRRIAFFHAHVPKQTDHYSRKDRIAGYSSFMAEHGLVAQIKKLEVDIYSAEPTTSDELASRASMRDWLQGPNIPEAVFCNNDSEAMAFQQLLYELKLRVPEDIAVIGYDDDEICRLSSPPMSTIHIPRYEMAVAAVNMAVSMINLSNGDNAYRLAPTIKFTPKLIVRKSSQAIQSIVPAAKTDETDFVVRDA